MNRSGPTFGRTLSRWLRAPLLHFVVGGAVVFWIARMVPTHGPGDAAIPPPSAPIVFTADDVAATMAAYQEETGQIATPADEVAVIRRAADEEMLYREAIARSLDRFDRSVRYRLVQKMRFLHEDDPRTDDELYQVARELDLGRGDAVIRRLLVEKLRLILMADADEAPREDRLRVYFEQRSGDYRLPARVGFAHVFLSHRERGDAVARDGATLLARLRREEPTGDEIRRLGDAFPLAGPVRSATVQQLADTFGGGFAQAVFELDSDEWSGPIASTHGLHLVRIESRQPGTIPDFDDVRGRVLERWRRDRRDARLDETMRTLRARYPVDADSDAWRERERG